MGYVYGHRNSHRTSNIWAPPSEPPRPLRPRGMFSVRSKPSLTRCWRGHGGRWHPADPHRAEAAIGRSGAAQGDYGDLVRGVLRHAVACHRSALRHRVQHAVHALCPRLGLWRRLLDRLRRAWRLACGDTADPSTVVIDSRSADGTRPTRRGPKPALTGAALRKAIMAIWCVCFCGLQWRAIGQLCDIPFGTLYTLFARWTRLGLWRRLLNRLILAWRQACGDTADPSAV